MARDNLSLEDAQERIAAQMTQDEKKEHADYLIDTSDGFEQARKRTKDVFQELRRQSRTGTRTQPARCSR